jgi:hypothetical protein
MQEVSKIHEPFTQFAGKTIEAITLWADASQSVVQELVKLSTTTTREGARLYGELQSSAVQALREGQAYWARRQAEAPEIPADPVLWIQKELAESLEAAQKAVRLLEGNAQAVTKSVDQLQTAAEQTAKEIQETLAALATKLQEVCRAA